MSFQVGDRVLCVEDEWIHRGEIEPKAGMIYMVREFVKVGLFPGIRLCEIINTPRPYIDGFAEVAWNPSAFRKLGDCDESERVLDEARA